MIGLRDDDSNHIESGGGGGGGEGVFGPVQTYYAAVETNGRGMLHLHGLVWLQGNMRFERLRERIQKEAVFGKRVVQYLESVIRESVDIPSICYT